MLGVGLLYWVLWAKVPPLFGYKVNHEIVTLSDGSEIVRYIVSFHLLQTLMLESNSSIAREANENKGRSSRRPPDAHERHGRGSSSCPCDARF